MEGSGITPPECLHQYNSNCNEKCASYLMKESNDLQNRILQNWSAVQIYLQHFPQASTPQFPGSRELAPLYNRLTFVLNKVNGIMRQMQQRVEYEQKQNGRE